MSTNFASLVYRTIRAMGRAYRVPFGMAAVAVLALVMALPPGSEPPPVAAQGNPVPVQTFYVPWPEGQLLQGLQAIESGGSGTAPTSPITTYVSLAAVADGTIIYYDQWENGYDADIGNPGNLYSAGNPGGTQIWGDGNPANGAPPGIPSDIIDAGTVIVLNNAVNTSTPGVIDFDGRDKIAATKNIAVTRTGWAAGSGTLLAGAVEVYDTLNWGTFYRAPVGENITTDADMFSYTGLAIMAGPGGATVQVDANADGSYETTVTLGEGQSHLVNGGVNVGARVSSNNPVQVDILTGDRASSYESRDSALLPVASWSSSYYTPVSTASPNGTSVWLYNPNATSITVTYQRRVAGVLTTSTFSVPAGGTYEQSLPVNTPAHFYTTSGAIFYAFSTTDSSADSSGNQAYDWGFSLIPQGSLTPQVLIGLGIGRDPTSGVNLTENGNPIWVTPIGNGNTYVTVYVDYDADPTTGALTDPNGNHYDVSYSLRELDQQKIYDPGDRNQTGTLVYVLTPNVKLAAAWGQDPLAASAAAPGLDVGTSVPPTPLFSAGKNGTLYDDNDGDGFISPGDELEYTIVINNISRAPVPDVIVKDNLPADTTYVLSSTYNETAPAAIPDNAAPATPFPLDVSGANVGTIPVGGSITVTFHVIITNPVTPGTTEILNSGSASAVGITVPFQDITPLGGIGDFVWNDVDMDGIQDAGETGIAGVVVNLYASDGTTLVATATTDASGFYAFTGLDSGSYIVEFVKPAGFNATPQNQGADDALDSDADPITGRTAVFSWTAGQTNTTIDAGFWMPTPKIEVTKTANPTSVPETGGNVTFTYVVANTGNVPVTISSLSDDKFGTLAGDADCAVGTVLAYGTSCSFDATFAVPADSFPGSHVNVFTATGTGNGTTVSDTEDETVTYTDVLPEITVTKTGLPSSVPETGGNVTFTYRVENTGDVTAWITSLSDDRFGTLLGDVGCQVGTQLAAGASCSFTATFAIPAGAAGSTHVNVFTAGAEDVDGNDTSDTEPEIITRSDVLPAITVTKTGSPLSVPETGGNVTFTYTVENTGDVTAWITSLLDDQFGPLSGDLDCAVGTELAAGASCTFDATFAIPAGAAGSTHVDVFTASVEDAEDNPASDTDDETIGRGDVLPAIMVTKSGLPTSVPETGGDVVFTYTVQNTGTVTAWITSLSDDKFGTLAGDLDCAVGTALPAGESCSFEATFAIPAGAAGSTHVDVFTASVEDAEDNPASDTDDETITRSDVLPEITVTKTGAPIEVPETGGSVTFTYVVENTGDVTAWITSLSDDKFGPLSGDADCAVTTELAAGASCSFEETFAIPAGDYPGSHVDVFTGGAVDAEDNPASDTDDETITYTDVRPDISVTKDAFPSEVPETGGWVDFTIVVTNNGSEAVTLNSLTDTVFGNLDGQGTCAVPQTLPGSPSFLFFLLAPVNNYTCSFSAWVDGDVGIAHEDTVTAGASDGDGNTDTASDGATVTFSDVLPEVYLVKDVTPVSRAEPGGVFSYTLVIYNISPEAVTITALTDSNALSAECVALIGTSIPVSGMASCTYTVTHTDAGSYPNTASVSVEDNEGNSASDSDDQTVTVTDELPEVDLVKDVTPASLPEPGGVFSYTLTITNNSVENVTITALTDDNPLPAACTDLIGDVLTPGQSVSCTYDVTQTEAGSYPNAAVVTAEDNEGNWTVDIDSETVSVSDVLPTVDLTKSALPASLPEPGGVFSFTLEIHNSSPEAVTITDLGDSNTLSAECWALIGTSISAGETVSCTYTVTHTDAGSYLNSASVTVVDNEGNPASDSDDEIVAVTDVLPVVDLVKGVTPATLPEPGGVFSYTLTITNNSVENVTITALTDDNPLPVACTDLIGDVLTPGQSVSCTYDVTQTEAGSYPNTASVSVEDNEGNPASDTDSETVTVNDVLPVVDLVKDVTPASLPEPGGVFSYTLTITNNSVENVTITALTDDNPLPAACTDLIGDVLTPGQSVSCTYDVTHTEAGSYPNAAVVTAEDNEGNWTGDTDSETVSVSDVLPTVNLTKSALPASLPEPGGVFSFKLEIYNSSPEAVTITALGDSNALSAECLALIGTSIPAGGTVSCTYAVTHTDAGSYPNTASVTVVDNEGNPASDSDDEIVAVTDVPPEITVTKTGSPTWVPETGGNVTFTYTVENTGDVTAWITSLSDNPFGPLAGDLDCAVGTELAAGASCSFEATFPIPAGAAGSTHVDTFTAHAEDAEENDAWDDESETITRTDVLPEITVTKTGSPTFAPETGGDVTFTYMVENTGTVTVWITGLGDDQFGPLSGDADCTVGTELAPGASCSFSATFAIPAGAAGTTHVDVFTAYTKDAERNDAIDDESETITRTDVLPAITVAKVGFPASVPETGGDVTFTYTVENTGTVTAWITSLSDDQFGTLAGDLDCMVGTELAPDTYCEFDATFPIPAGDYPGSHVDVFTAHVDDADENDASDTDDESITYTDVLPDISVAKDAYPTEVPETGGWVTFTVVVSNLNSEAVTLTSLSDSVFGDLDGKGDCSVPQPLAGAPSSLFVPFFAPTFEYTCSFTEWVEGDFEGGAAHENTVTAAASDDDGNSDEATDDATVTFTDVDPSIDVEKYVSIDGGATWVDADTATGPYLNSGTAPQFKFVVTNTGTVDLSNVDVTDNVFGNISLNGTLLAGTSVDFVVTGAWAAGQHSNTATASGEMTDGNGNIETATDSDAANYFGADPAIDAEKYVSIDGGLTWVDADAATGPYLISGTAPQFKFVVENVGNVALSNIVLTDSDFDLSSCAAPGSLAVGASFECSITSSWTAGQHSNTATASGDFTDGNGDAETATDSDDANYFGADPAIDVEKYVSVDGGASWLDADSVTGPYLNSSGSDPLFKFRVENVGNVALSNVALADSDFTISGCKLPSPLPAGSSLECTITGSWAAGQHSNTATASGDFTDGNGDTDTAGDTDDANYFGADPAIDVEKYVSIDGGLTWVDADTATGPYLISGTAPQFKFVVENVGNVALSNVALADTDFDLSGCTAPSSLAVAASFECSITGGWASGQHTDTATASGSFTDGAGNTESESDSDDANYFGASPSFTVSKACSSTEPVPQEGPATFTVTFTNDGNVPLSVTADDGIGPFDLAVGEAKSFEVPVAGPFSGLATVDNTVSGSSSYTDGAGHSATVSHESSASCRVGARTNLHKTTNGSIDPAYDWSFAIFAGSHYGEGSGFLSGSPLMTASTLGDALGILFDQSNLDPTLAYAVCEVPVNATAGWSSLWTINGLTVPVYNPHSFDPIKQSLGYHCVDIGTGEAYGLTAGGTLDIFVDNSYPGGEPRTPGYWKNWSSCTGGGQYDHAVTNDLNNEFWALDELLNNPGFIVGDLILNPTAYGSDSAALCQDAVSVLDQRDSETGAKASSDAAYTLAMHLMAAQLNFAAGAETCTAATDAVLAGQQLLEQYNFTGSGDYLRPRGALKADYYYALSIAKLLDEYNNGLLCGGAAGVDDPPSVAISSPSAGDLVSGPVSIAASATDDVGVTQVEFFVDGVSIGIDTDGSNGWSAAWDSTLAPEGSHSLSATATDTQGQTGSASITVTVDNVPDPKMHVGDLTVSVTPAKGGRWNASVTVTVHDASHNGLAGTLVSMGWSDGKTATCTTGSDGSCTIVRKGIPSSISSLTLEVTGITLNGYAYDMAANHVTSIAVSKP